MTFLISLAIMMGAISCSPDNLSSEKIKERLLDKIEPIAVTKGGIKLHRYEDEEIGVMCYMIFSGKNQLSCIPL